MNKNKTTKKTKEHESGNLILAYFAIVNITLVILSYPLIIVSYVMNEYVTTIYSQNTLN